MRARLTVPASMSNEPGAATSSSPPGSRKTDRSAASPATETTTVEARLHSSSRLPTASMRGLAAALAAKAAVSRSN